MSDLCVGEGVVGEDGAEEELLLHLPRRARLLREAPEEPKYIPCCTTMFSMFYKEEK